MFSQNAARVRVAFDPVTEDFHMVRQLSVLVALGLIATGVNAQTVATGDPRSVSTPTYPAVCETLSAQFSTSARSSPPSSDDTSRIQSALTTCAGTGKSVVLAASELLFLGLDHHG